MPVRYKVSFALEGVCVWQAIQKAWDLWTPHPVKTLQLLR